MTLREMQNWRYTSIYPLKLVDQEAIERATTDPPNGDNWGRQLNELKNFKESLKRFLTVQQKNTCAYCRLPIFYRMKKPIEHIIPKGTYPQFTFEVRNLTLTCDYCNTKKNDKDTLAISLRERYRRHNERQYPSTSNDFLIVHPHFDDYFIHIDISDTGYVGKTPKGSFTVRECGLFETKLVEEFIKLTREYNPIMQEVMDLISRHGSDRKLIIEKLLDTI